MANILQQLRERFPEAKDQELLDVAAEILDEELSKDPKNALLQARRREIEAARILASPPGIPRPQIRMEEQKFNPLASLYQATSGLLGVSPETAARIYGGLAGAAQGALTGTAAGIPGMAAGAVLGGGLGALAPPKTVGEAALFALGGVGGRSLGPLVSGITSPALRTAAAGAAGSGLALGGMTAARGIDVLAGERSPETREILPTSPGELLGAAMSGLLPAAVSSTRTTMERGPGFLTRRLQEEIPALRGKSSAEVLGSPITPPELLNELRAGTVLQDAEKLPALQAEKIRLAKEIARLRLEQAKATRQDAAKLAQERDFLRARLAEIVKEETAVRKRLAEVAGEKQVAAIEMKQAGLAEKSAATHEKLLGSAAVSEQDSRIAELNGQIASERIRRQQIRLANRMQEIDAEEADELLRASLEREETLIARRTEALINRIQDNQATAAAVEPLTQTVADTLMERSEKLKGIAKESSKLKALREKLAGEAKQSRLEVPESRQAQIRTRFGQETARLRLEQAEVDEVISDISAMTEEFAKQHPTVYRVLKDAMTSDDFVGAFFRPDITADAVREIRGFMERKSPETIQKLQDVLLAELFRRAYDPKSRTLAGLHNLVIGRPGQTQPAFSLEKLNAILGDGEKAKRMSEFILDLAKTLQPGKLVPGSAEYILRRGTAHVVYAAPYMIFFHAGKLFAPGFVLPAGTFLLALSWPKLIDAAAKNPRFGTAFIRWLQQGATAQALAASPVLVNTLVKSGTPISASDALAMAGLSPTSERQP